MNHGRDPFIHSLMFSINFLFFQNNNQKAIKQETDAFSLDTRPVYFWKYSDCCVLQVLI